MARTRLLQKSVVRTNFDIYVLLDRHKIFKNDVCHEYLGLQILTISFLIVIIKQII